MSDRLNGVDVFVQAVDAGSFSLAAEGLHLTRSAVAKTIARLEQRLGTKLFHRTTRTQNLTEDGQAFYERCVRALAELDAGEAALDSGKREPKGVLRVSAPVLFGRYCVAPSLLNLSQTHPQLSIDLSFTDRVVDLVYEGFDLGVRIGTLADSTTLASRLLGVERMSVCASPAYLEKFGTPKTIEDLTGHDAIVYGRGGNQFPWQLYDEAGVAHDVMMKTRLRFDDLHSIADAAVAGYGLAWLPCWLVARYLNAKQLVLVFDSRRAVSREIHAVWPHTRFLPAKIRTGIDTLLAEVPLHMAKPCTQVRACES